MGDFLKCYGIFWIFEPFFRDSLGFLYSPFPQMDIKKKKRIVKYWEQTVLGAAVGAAIVAGQTLNVADDGLLQLDEALVDFGAVTSVIDEGLVQGALLAVRQHRHPRVQVVVLLRLEVVRPIIYHKLIHIHIQILMNLLQY